RSRGAYPHRRIRLCRALRTDEGTSDDRGRKRANGCNPVLLRVPSSVIRRLSFDIRGGTSMTAITTSPTRFTCASVATLLLLAVTPAFGEPAPAKIDAADTAWMISATGLVLMMTIPGLALFYWYGAQEERARHHGAEPVVHLPVLDPVGDGRLQPELHRRRGLLHRHLRAAVPARHRNGDDQPARQDHPRNAVHDLPDDLCGHHGRAGRGLGRRPHAVLRLCLVCGPVAHLCLCADRTLGVGQRLAADARAA